jgi:predicted HicB family RNase H-like nuclease
MQNNADHYTYKIFWFEPDHKFVGTCVEMPGLSHMDADADAASRGIRDLVRFVVDDMIRDGEQPPEAIADVNYSGQFVTRVPKILHARLALEARENGVSLNSLVNHKLSIPNPPGLGVPRKMSRKDIQKKSHTTGAR